MHELDYAYESDLTGYQYDSEVSGLLGSARDQLEALREEEL